MRRPSRGRSHTYLAAIAARTDASRLAEPQLVPRTRLAESAGATCRVRCADEHGVRAHTLGLGARSERAQRTGGAFTWLLANARRPESWSLLALRRESGVEPPFRSPATSGAWTLARRLRRATRPTSAWCAAPRSSRAPGAFTRRSVRGLRVTVTTSSLGEREAALAVEGDVHVALARGAQAHLDRRASSPTTSGRLRQHVRADRREHDARAARGAGWARPRPGCRRWSRWARRR